MAAVYIHYVKSITGEHILWLQYIYIHYVKSITGEPVLRLKLFNISLSVILMDSYLKHSNNMSTIMIM